MDSTIYKIRQTGNGFQVFKRHRVYVGGYETYTETETTLFSGTLNECEIYLRLVTNGSIEI
jgi:hypothetical protein